MKYTHSACLKTLLTACLITTSAISVASGYIQIGSEYEYYPQKENINYYRQTSYNPYLRFSYKPQDSDWKFSGRLLLKEYPHKDKYENKTSTGQSGLYELYATDYIRSGNFIFRPGIGVRIVPYDENNYYGERYEHQLRILPQFDYLLTKDSRLFVNGFFYVADSKGSRKNDRVTDKFNQGECTKQQANQYGFCSNKYRDWGYEFDFGLRNNINDFNSYTLGIHTEFDKVTNNYDSQLVQATLGYQYRLGKLTLGPYTRLALTRSIKMKSEKDPANNITLKQPYSRYGVYASYAFNGRWSAGMETYFQEEKMQDQKGDDMQSRRKWFFKLNAQYNF
ncbi:hypothetical protein V5085_04625 [Moellerella wisconsensis]|uniref:hypothetical protein n=1 Tax=Moellerella wisconsensis TaxID=158849 RepID=UPI00307661B9